MNRRRNNSKKGKRGNCKKIFCQQDKSSPWHNCKKYLIISMLTFFIFLFMIFVHPALVGNKNGGNEKIIEKLKQENIFKKRAKEFN